jgi:hypothetical protein
MKGAEVMAETVSGLLPRLRETLEQALRSHGFGAAAPTRYVDGRGLDDWHRELGWKTDGVGLLYRTPSPTYVEVPVYVRIPVRQGVEIDGTTASFLAGHGPFYELPSGLFRGSREDRLVETIGKDVLVALAWFDQYATPERCLARLDEEDRNGPRKGSPAHQAVVEHLRRFS